jgi:hypothetical protein
MNIKSNLIGYTIGIDGAQFSRQDLGKLKDKFEKIHNLALTYNVDLEIAGFDALPRQGTSLKHEWSEGLCVKICINTVQTYNLFQHPEFGGAVQSKALENRQGTPKRR